MYKNVRPNSTANHEKMINECDKGSKDSLECPLRAENMNSRSCSLSKKRLWDGAASNKISRHGFIGKLFGSKNDRFSALEDEGECVKRRRRL